jgi:surfeit locus 1 family protein
VAFVLLALVLGTLFVSCGVWQLDRRDQRRALNDGIRRQLALPPIAITELLSDSVAPNRRAVVSGTPDLANEIVVTGRSLSGSPGVYILTPVRLAARDTAILVNRGWVYSPDAASVDLNRWRESRRTFNGFTQRLSNRASTGGSARGRAVRQLSHPAVARLLPYPVHDLYLVAQDSAAGDSVPVRLEPPVLSDGPHLSYAIQWFAFAAIALIGTAVVVHRARHAERAGAQLARESE